MSLSLTAYRMGSIKGRAKGPCPSVYAPASALRSLSSVALSSAPASETLSRSSTVRAIPPHFSQTISSTFLFEAMNLISSTFLREATGVCKGSIEAREVSCSHVNDCADGFFRSRVLFHPTGWHEQTDHRQVLNTEPPSGAYFCSIRRFL